MKDPAPLFVRVVEAPTVVLPVTVIASPVALPRVTAPLKAAAPLKVAVPEKVEVVVVKPALKVAAPPNVLVPLKVALPVKVEVETTLSVSAPESPITTFPVKVGTPAKVTGPLKVDVALTVRVSVASLPTVVLPENVTAPETERVLLTTTGLAAVSGPFATISPVKVETPVKALVPVTEKLPPTAVEVELTVSLSAPPVTTVMVSVVDLRMPVLVSAEKFMAGVPTVPSVRDRAPVMVPPASGRRVEMWLTASVTFVASQYTAIFLPFGTDTPVPAAVMTVWANPPEVLFQTM
jgi:hypothetical protein